jgi:hypothetical protein
MGDDALDADATYDFGALQGIPLTNLHVPEPRATWQRAKSLDDPNYTSALQVHCFDAGIFINTWQFEPQVLIDEGPARRLRLRVFRPAAGLRRNPATDLAIQAQLEVPWLYRPQGRRSR